MIVFIIGVCGPSASGKTTLARELILRLDGGGILSADDYYHDKSNLTALEVENYNFDHPSALDHELLTGHLECLKNGGEINAPIYDYKTHGRSESFQSIKADKVLVLEGMYLYLSEQLRELIDLRIYVDADPDIRLARRLLRDSSERGRGCQFDKQIKQYLRFVKPMHERFSAIQLTFAHEVYLLNCMDQTEAVLQKVLNRIDLSHITGKKA